MCSENKNEISCAVTAQLICVFVFTYTDCWFSGAAAYLSIWYVHLTVILREHYGNSGLYTIFCVLSLMFYFIYI